MAKTYPDIGTFSPGDILTAATMNDVGTNLDNQRVPPSALISRVTTQSIPDSTITYVQFTAEGWDTDGIANLGTNNDRLTIQTPGLYLVTGNAALAGNATGQREIGLWQSPTPSWSSNALIASNAWTYGSISLNLYQEMSVSVVTKCSAGDYLRLHVWQNAGTLNLQADQRPASLSVTWLGQAS